MSRIKESKKGSVKLPSFANNTTINGVLQQRYNYIPIDYIKARAKGLPRNHFLRNIGFEDGKILKHKELIFTPSFENGTSDAINKYYCICDGILIEVYETGTIHFSGSIHKFYNGGLHNYNEFDEVAFIEALKRIDEVFKIKPRNLELIKIEYGLNITPPIETNEILNNLIQHKNKDFEHKISNEHGNYYQCERSNYIIKIYNKSLQYGCNNEILRIEIKQTNWSEYRKQGLYTLEDFISCDKLQFVNNLLTKWNDIVYYDSTNKGVERWDKYSSINFWRELRTKTDTTIKRHRDRLRELNKTKGLNVQQLINDEVIKTINNLQGVRNYNFIENRRYCVLTGIEITMQRKDSFLLSHGGLYHLLKNDPETFQRIKNKFLTNKWLTSSIHKQVKEIAHNIRTKYSNRKERFFEGQLTLFETPKGKELQVYI